MNQNLEATGLPEDVVTLLFDFLGRKHGEGRLQIHTVGSDHSEKSQGAKRLWFISYHQADVVHRYYLKTATRAAERMQGDEGLVTELRLARSDMTEWAVTSVSTNQSLRFVPGVPDQVFTLEKSKRGVLLADVLTSRSVDDQAYATDLVRAITTWLAEKQVSVEDRPHQYVRELFGGSYGLMATLDYFPREWLCKDIASRLLQYALRWRRLLLSRPMVKIHGDFHPWNIFFCEEGRSLATTGTLHTPFGAAEDDWCCLGVNLAVMAAEGAQDLGTRRTSPQWKILKDLERSAQAPEQWATGFFCGWRLMILANPRHYPRRSRRFRNRLIRGALWCLHDSSRNKGSMVSLLDEVFTSNPWVKEASPARAVSAPTELGTVAANAQVVSPAEAKEIASVGEDTSARTVEVSGQVLHIRHHGRVTFVDLKSDEGKTLESVQLIVQHKRMGADYSKLLDCLGQFDWIRVAGVPVMSRTGEPSVDVESVEWLSHNTADQRTARRVYRRAEVARVFSGMLDATRSVLQEYGFREVWTPTLDRSFNGGKAHPFVTRRRCDDEDCYLRVTMELRHKELLAGGIPRLYQIGSSFRNESRDRSHLPEFLMLEAYASDKGLEWVESVAVEIVRQAWKATRVDRFPSVETMSVEDALRKFLEVNPSDRASLRQHIQSLTGRQIHGAEDLSGAVYGLIRNRIRNRLTGVHLLRGVPPRRAPLINSDIAEGRSWLHVAGTSIADICVEETRPGIVMDSLSSQEEYVHSTVHRDYRDFLAALKVGLPFCTGMGLSLSRLAQVLASYEDIRATEWWET